MREYLSLFEEEAKKLLKDSQNLVLKLEKDPKNLEIINQLFRNAHTLKGMAATMNFKRISDFSHALEDVLDDLRNKKISVNTQVIELLLKAMDILEDAVDNAVKTGKDIISEEDMKLVENFKKGKFKYRFDEKRIVKSVENVSVPISVLDKMMNLVGELLTIRMALETIEHKYKIEEFSSILTKFARTVDELQYEITQVRMLPLSQIFERFPRMVRDLAKEQGKKIEFYYEGGDIRIEKKVLDKLGEILIHLIRNAIDHGIEKPEERKKAGKKEVGIIKLVARREGEKVIVEVIDDGRGFDIDALRKAIVKKGILSEEEAEKLTKDDVIRILLTHSGISTAKKVTKISGRGVGLEAVKRMVESINGAMHIFTEKGKGTRIVLVLPPTTAIVKCLLFKIAEQKFAIPISAVESCVKVSELTTRKVKGRYIFIWKNTPVPLINLADIFNLYSEKKGDFALIVKAITGKVCLVVDDILEMQELMVKPLDKLIRNVSGFSGVGILGTGEIVLVLDVNSLIEQIMSKV